MSLSERLQGIRSQIAAASDRSHRDPRSVQLLAVSKMQPDELIEEAYAAGQRDFGENYVQELQRKKDLFRHLPGIRWHLIGALQSNKVKSALACADYFHALDSEKLLAEIAKRGSKEQPWPVFIEVNVDGQASKSGINPDQLPSFAMKVLETPQVSLQGLMAIPEPQSPAEKMRPAFIALREMKRYLESHCGRTFNLSMGMSEDFEVAIEEGSNWIRVGRKLFGERRK